MGDKNKGFINGKFRVYREDDTDQPGGKHHGCWLFILDLNHDPHAIPALRAYAQSCRKDGYKLLADDIEKKIVEHLQDSIKIFQMDDCYWFVGTSLESCVKSPLPEGQGHHLSL